MRRQQTSAVLIALVVLASTPAITLAAPASSGSTAETPVVRNAVQEQADNETTVENVTVENLTLINTTLQHVQIEHLVVNVTTENGTQKNVTLEDVAAERITIGNATLRNVTFENLSINESLAFALFGKGLPVNETGPTTVEAGRLVAMNINGVVLGNVTIESSDAQNLTIKAEEPKTEQGEEAENETNETEEGEEEYENEPQAEMDPAVEAESVTVENGSAANVTITGWSANKTENESTTE